MTGTALASSTLIISQLPTDQWYNSIGQAAWGLGFGTVSGGLQGWAGRQGTTYRW